MARQPDRSERVFKTAWFSKAARKALITGAELCVAIRQVILGQADDLGGGVYSCGIVCGWRFAMTTKRRYKSDAFEAIHSSASAMFKVGAIDKATMREFDESCLAAPAPKAPRHIKRIRESQRVSQPVFARYLNTSESTVEKWESGAKKPSGMALKLLDIVEKHGLKTLT
jgi:putative transcriptional regulator